MITSYYMEHSITWAFVDVAAFVNRCWSRAFFTSMFGRYLFSSCVGSHTSSAFLVTLTDHPVIPFAMNYNIVKVWNNISIIVIQSVPVIIFLYYMDKKISHLDILCPYTFQFPRVVHYRFLREILQQA